MKKAIAFGLVVLFLTACNGGRYQLPKADYQAQVQVLGVLPLLIDRSAPINYPHLEGLYDLLERSNQGKHEELVARLKQKKGYFDVRSLPGNPDLLAMSLLVGEQPVTEAGRPKAPLLSPAAVNELLDKNVLDGLLLVIFSGAQVEEARRSRTMLESLNTRFSDIMATAVVVGRDGRLLWQLTEGDSYQALVLQYADFDEAYFNRTDQVRVKNIALSGLAPQLQGEPDTPEELPKLYSELFDKISSGISPGLFDALRR